MFAQFDFYYLSKTLVQVLRTGDFGLLKLLLWYPKKFKGFSIPYEGYNRREIRNQLFEGFASETYTRSLIIKSEAPVIIDLGMSYGLIALSLHHFFPKARLYCFEPNPLAIDYAKKLFSINSMNCVEIIPKAVGLPGTFKLHVNPKHFETANTSMAYSKDSTTFDVESISLSDFIQKQKIEKIDFLKMDIEGPETEVIEDLHSAGLLEKIDNLILELHVFKSPRRPKNFELLSKLHAAGFSIKMRTTGDDAFQTRHLIWANRP